MTVRYDGKGKYYTEVVNKTPLKSTIQTMKGRMEGTLYVHPDNRLLDELNEGPPFLAVTNVRVMAPEGEMETEFLILRKDQILWVAPHEEVARADGN